MNYVYERLINEVEAKSGMEKKQTIGGKLIYFLIRTTSARHGSDKIRQSSEERKVANSSKQNRTVR